MTYLEDPQQDADDHSAASAGNDQLVGTAVWWRRHPILAGGALVLVVVSLVVVGIVVVGFVTAPALACGSGMTDAPSQTECVGIDLDSAPMRADEPSRMNTLEAAIRANNDAVTGPYLSIVFVQDFTPVAGTDTITYPDIYPNIEGAIAAVWQANYTATYLARPAIKLFLANLGSENAQWQAAADSIHDNAPANNVVSVIGLGQSTDETRDLVSRLTTFYPESSRLPVIGATVTGDDMNLDPQTHQLLLSFFRVAPQNTGTVAAAERYLRDQQELAHVGIVGDNVGGDDYTKTLVSAATADFPGAHFYPYRSPSATLDSKYRAQQLANQFDGLQQNICEAGTQVVFFAGRGTDIGTFMKSATQYPTNCARQPLLIMAGDDGAEAINDPDVYAALNQSGRPITLMYTALANPDQWGTCGTAGRQAFDLFRSAFTGTPSCGVDPATAGGPDAASAAGARPHYPAVDLDSGQAMITHDAVAVAILAGRRQAKDPMDPNNVDVAPLVADPTAQVGNLEAFQCDLALNGASGTIEYLPDASATSNARYYGNPVGRSIPIVRIMPAGGITVFQSLESADPLQDAPPKPAC